jgi:hypothetical protein
VNTKQRQETDRTLAADRATEIRDYVERLISLVGEHPECELKKSWPRTTPYHKAEVVKDIQATANSSITPGKNKYIVIGADQQTRTITGCNSSDYDDASIRQLLEQYLDPVPEFEVLSLKSSTNVGFVVIRFPYQKARPFFAKAQIRGDRNQIYLAVGQVWIKPGGANTGSSGKRLVSSRQELFSLINTEPKLIHEPHLRLPPTDEVRRKILALLKSFHETPPKHSLDSTDVEEYHVLLENLQRELSCNLDEFRIPESAIKTREIPQSFSVDMFGHYYGEPYTYEQYIPVSYFQRQIGALLSFVESQLLKGMADS